MKKSLSLLVAIAMVFTMFASVAFADDATTPAASPSPSPSATPMDAQAKFDALKAKGIFEGFDAAGTAGLDKEMTRAQFAKTLVVLNGLTEDKASSSVYTDLDGAGWAAGFIGAATKAGYMDGVATGKFDPSGNVTIEQLATVLVRVFKLQVDATANVTGTVSGWAKANVAAAITAGFISNTTDFTKAAKRDLLVTTAYTAYLKIQAGAPVTVVTKVSVAEFKATGAKTLSVKLNGALADTSKLTVSINRGGSAVTGKQTWNATKNEVTIVLDSKMTAATYSVKLDAVKDGGLTIDKGTADVTVTEEKIGKIEFTTASDTVAQGKIKIGFKATNQYNEVSDFSASRFTIGKSPDGLPITSAGDEQSVTVNTNVYSNGGILTRDQVFVITIVAPDNTAQASKSFKVGDLQSVGKIELGDVKYATGKTNLEANETALIAYKAWDQYGMPVSDLSVLQKGTSAYYTGAGAIDGTTVLSTNGTTNYTGFAFVDDETGDNIPDLKVKAASAVNIFNDQDVTLSVVAFATAQTASKVIKVTAPKVPYEASFGSYNNVIAIGDDDIYIPLVVKDQFGNVLSSDDIVTNVDKINIFGSGLVTVDPTVVKTGADKGKVHLVVPKTGTNTGSFTITALVTRTAKSATYSSSLSLKRYPNQVYVSSETKPKLLPSLTAGTYTQDKFKIRFKDQYGEDFDRDYTGYNVSFDFKKTSGVTDAVYFSRGAYSATTPVKLNSTTTSVTQTGTDTTVDGFIDVNTSIKHVRDTDLIFSAGFGDDNEGSYQTTIKLINSANGSTMSTVSRTVDLIKAKEGNNLTYTVAPFTNGIYAIDKISGTMQGSTDQSVAPRMTIAGTPVSSEVTSMENWFSGKVEVTAKDSGGNNVQLPDAIIRNVTVSNNQVAAEVAKPKSDQSNAVTFDTYGIRGKDVGTTSVTVSFIPSNYTGYKFATIDNVAIKNDGLFANSLTAAENGKTKTIALSALNGLNIFSGDTVVPAAAGVAAYTVKKKTLGDVKIKDQYGYTEFKNYSVVRTALVFGTQFLISNVRWGTATTGSIGIEYNSTNAPITASNGTTLNVGEAKYIYVAPAVATDLYFTVTVITANGKVQTVDVYVDPSK